MTASPTEHPDCRCGHSHKQHAALAPQCSATRCECLRYQREIRDLRDRLTSEDHTAKALAEIAELEKQLAAAKARIKTMRRDAGLPGGERSAGAGACPDCGEHFDTAQRLGVHRRWKHDYRKSTAS